MAAVLSTDAEPLRRKRRKLTPAAQERILSLPATIDSIGAAQAQEQRRRLQRVRIGLARIVCSSNWFDANWHGTHMIVRERGVDVCRVVSAPYPPGGDESTMRPCQSRRCQGRLYPASYMTSSGHCCDCQERAISARRRRAGLVDVRRTTSVVDQSKMNASRVMGKDYVQAD
jgi:hypothetical protein